ncbi:MAG: hybrid sensor histidine kinase/response regulator [Pseudomonadota bacterium]
MSTYQIDDVERLQRINEALVNRVERAMDQQQNAFSLFQTAISLDGQVRRRTDELTATMRRLEKSNVELEREKEISEIANRSKTRFLAAASHDVLQPLNAAQLTVSALADLQTSQKGRELVGQIERSLETMDELLKTLLDISKLDAGVVVPKLEAVSLPDVIGSLVSDFTPATEKKGLQLSTTVADVAVISDRTMLRRILQNLIANAIRYTSEGTISVTAALSEDQVGIQVSDTGCGIEDGEKEQIFEEFQRGANPRVGDGDAGLGLGLAIVKRLVLMLNHGIAFSSVPGMGSQFTVRARLAKEEEKPRTRAPAAGRTLPFGGLAGTKVLLLENEPSVTAAMETLLTNWGCIIRNAAASDEAFAQLAPDNWLPDLIIADQQLDSSDLGTEVASEIRQRLQRDIPVLVATANPTQSVAEEVRKLGAELMQKPVKPAQLRALMYHLVKRRGAVQFRN